MRKSVDTLSDNPPALLRERRPPSRVGARPATTPAGYRAGARRSAAAPSSATSFAVGRDEIGAAGRQLRARSVAFTVAGAWTERTSPASWPVADTAPSAIIERGRDADKARAETSWPPGTIPGANTKPTAPAAAGKSRRSSSPIPTAALIAPITGFVDWKMRSACPSRTPMIQSTFRRRDRRPGVGPARAVGVPNAAPAQIGPGAERAVAAPVTITARTWSSASARSNAASSRAHLRGKAFIAPGGSSMMVGWSATSTRSVTRPSICASSASTEPVRRPRR